MTDLARRGELFRSLREQSFSNADLLLLAASGLITSVVALLGLASFLR